MARALGILCCALLLSSCGGPPLPMQPPPLDSRKVEDVDPLFAKMLLESKTPVLVDFWGEGCPPCLVMGPILDELAAANEGKFKLVKVNVADKEALAGYYGIDSIPTVILFKNGVSHRRLPGLPHGDAKAQVANWLKRALAG
ncbi:MAG: thioredoxin family protein [Gemmataceae bacterium]|nr:thioredoxin family protein [Gemmataceae bacterium]